MLEGSSFHTNSRAETFAPLIICVIDVALLKTMPETASVHRHHELARPAAAFIVIFL